MLERLVPKGALMGNLLTDMRYGARMLGKHPFTSAIVVLTLALGIGANTAIFSAVNILLLRPLPVQNSDRLLYLATKQQSSQYYNVFSYLDFQDLRSQNTVFSDVIGYNIYLIGMNAGDKPDSMMVSYVSGNYFKALGLNPTLGTLISGQEIEKPGADATLVLDYSYWQSRFNSDPNIVGRQIKLNGHPATIIGVAPKSFHGLYSMVEMQGYLPLGTARIQEENNDLWTKRDYRSLKTLAILKPEVNMQRAQSAMDLLAQQLAQQYGDADKGLAIHVFPERMARPTPSLGKKFLVGSTLFLILAALVLILACSSVVNLLLVQAMAREREMAVRASLGAARIRLIQQILTENFILAILGCVSGIVLGYFASRLLASIHFATVVPIHFDVGFDWRVFAFALFVGILAALGVGLIPALRLSHTRLGKLLQENSRGVLSGTSTRSRLRSGLVVAQMAGSLLLVVAAGLFIRSLDNAQHINLGFNADNLLNISMDTQAIGMDKAQSDQFYRQLTDKVRALPGVRSVTTAYSAPMDYYNNVAPVYPEGATASTKRETPQIPFNNVDPEYFSTMGITILEGRIFTAMDTEKAPLVAIINQNMAKRLWNAEHAIGKRFSISGPSGPLIEVVGIARDGKYLALTEETRPFYYVPLLQNDSSLRVVHVRTTLAPGALMQPAMKEIYNLAPDLPVIGSGTMRDAIGGPNGLFLFRLLTTLTEVLGLLGLVLATIGVYGVLSFLTSQRTRDIGIRMALGANRKDIMRMIVLQGLQLVALSLFIGLSLTLAGTRILSSVLFGVNSKDPLILFAASTLITAVGLIACMVPARRATRVDPIIALRYD